MTDSERSASSQAVSTEDRLRDALDEAKENLRRQADQHQKAVGKLRDALSTERERRNHLAASVETLREKAAEQRAIETERRSKLADQVTTLRQRFTAQRERHEARIDQLSQQLADATASRKTAQADFAKERHLRSGLQSDMAAQAKRHAAEIADRTKRINALRSAMAVEKDPTVAGNVTAAKGEVLKPDRVVVWVQHHCLVAGTPQNFFLANTYDRHTYVPRSWQLLDSDGKEIKRGDFVEEDPLPVLTNFDAAPDAPHLQVDTVDLPPGFYELRVDVDQRRKSVEAHANAASCWFGVRSSTRKPGEIALLVPTFTLQAYNAIDGQSFYRPNPKDQPGVRRIDRTRPFSRRRHTKAPYHSFTPAIAFERAVRELGYTPAPVDSTWVHDSTNEELGEFAHILITAHDEYLSTLQRENLAEYVNTGGRLSIFCGNFCWWKIHVEEGGTLSVCKVLEDRGEEDKRGIWARVGVGTDPSSDFGLTFRHGGYPLKRYLDATDAIEFEVSPSDLERSRGMRVFDKMHPLFAGTDLENGDWFGIEEEIVDVEVDGIRIDADGKVLNEFRSAAADSLRPIATAKLVRLLGGKQVIEPATIAELSNGSGGRIVHLGSCTWFRAEQFRDGAAFQVLCNTIKYQMDKEPNQ